MRLNNEFPVDTPCLTNTRLLVSAECAAYVYRNFRSEFMRDNTTLIKCSKFDEGDLSEKLAAVIESDHIESITVIRMELPCCFGIETAVEKALQNSGRMIPRQTIVIGTNGEILQTDEMACA